MASIERDIFQDGGSLPKAQEGIIVGGDDLSKNKYQSGTSETLTNLARNMASYFLGAKHSNLPESNYKPTIASDKNAKYYTYQYLKNDVKEDLLSDIYIKNTKTQQDNFKKQNPDYIPVYIKNKNFNDYYNFLSNAHKAGRMSGSSINLGQYKVSTGEDEKGRYLSIYDKYDWNLLKELGFNGNSWETYDRIYESEWDKIKMKKAKGGSLPMYQDGGKINNTKEPVYDPDYKGQLLNSQGPIFNKNTTGYSPRYHSGDWWNPTTDTPTVVHDPSDPRVLAFMDSMYLANIR